MNNARQQVLHPKDRVRYLNELHELCHVPVTENTITPLSELARLREEVKRMSVYPRKKFTIPFDEKTGQRFGLFIEQLERLNPSPIYIWTEAANGCGLFLLDSLAHLNRNFPYSLNVEGIVVLLAKNLRDRMILDFYEEGSRKVLEIELIGETWPNAIF